MKFRSLYIHFPFCETKCHYCDFYSIAQARTSPADVEGFALALSRELAQKMPEIDDTLDTVFLGGGTPSMTDPEVMTQILSPLVGRVNSSTEWTMEANPSSVDLERLKKYRTLGVNRISMGVQATQDHFLKLLGRVHSRDRAIQSLKAITEAGFENISVDLLCGIPGQTQKDIEESLKLFSEYPITHLSCYLLTLPSHHPLHAQLPNEDEQLAHLLFLHEWMEKAGFHHYEISNFSRAGRPARHNLAYWKGHSYLGLGPSAHSFDANLQKRWKNVSSLKKYASSLSEGKLPVEWEEQLNADQQQLERWMLALRLSDGFPVNWLEKTFQKQKAAAFQIRGLLENHPERPEFLRLTPKGFALSDAVIRELAS